MCNLSPEEKIALFRSIFRGREDVFARRWFSRTSGKSGYQPVCRKEWNRDFCDKKKYKCADCPNREFEQQGYDYNLKRIAAFRNPEFFAKQGMRLPTYNIPRIISCAEITDDYLIMPRGCEDLVIE